jgi:hypothetical protein
LFDVREFNRKDYIWQKQFFAGIIFEAKAKVARLKGLPRTHGDECGRDAPRLRCLFPENLDSQFLVTIIPGFCGFTASSGNLICFSEVAAEKKAGNRFFIVSASLLHLNLPPYSPLRPPATHTARQGATTASFSNFQET